MTPCRQVLVNELFAPVYMNCLGLLVMGDKVCKVVLDFLYGVALLLQKFCGIVLLGVIDE